MLKSSAAFIKVIVYLTICNSALAQPQDAISTHCKAGEFAYLNANMSKVQPQDGGYKLVKTGKVLSICADRKAEPFQSVTYRYGSAGNVEMERVATRESRFRIFNRSTSTHTGQNLIFFSVGAFTYCVSEATGQGNGIGLTVFKSGRKVSHLFSGNDRGVDFGSEMIEINFDRADSPIFKLVEPTNSFQTACDEKK
jgi:hypothetical protein